MTGNYWGQADQTYNPFYLGGSKLQQMNQILCNNVTGGEGIRITIFFRGGVGGNAWGCSW